MTYCFLPDWTLACHVEAGTEVLWKKCSLTWKVIIAPSQNLQLPPRNQYDPWLPRHRTVASSTGPSWIRHSHAGIQHLRVCHALQMLQANPDQFPSLPISSRRNSI